MRILKVFIPGNSFADAFVYMGHLVATTTNRSIRYYELQTLAASLNHQLGGDCPLSTHMFARHDWLSGESFNLLMADDGIRNSIMRGIDTLTKKIDEQQNDFDFSYTETDLPIESNDILDTKCYSNRMYFATTDGVYHMDVDWQNVQRDNSVIKRLDIPCQSLTAAYGVVNASCASEGLYSALSDTEMSSTKNGKNMQRMASYSLRTGWMYYNLINYENYVDLEVFKGKIGSSDATEVSRGKNIITELEKVENTDFATIPEFENYHLSVDNVQYSFNSANQIYYHTYSGTLFSWFNPHLYGEAHRTSRWRQLDGPGSRILSASHTRAGMVVETDNHVLMLANDQWTKLVSGPVLSVRTYLASKRFKNLISIVAEDGIWLITAWDPHRG